MDGADPISNKAIKGNPPNPLTGFNPLKYNLPLTFAKNRPRYPSPSGESIKRYLNEIEEIGGFWEMDGLTTIGMALYYADPLIRSLWKINDSWMGHDWSEFKQDVLDLYPEVNATFNDLLSFTKPSQDHWQGSRIQETIRLRRDSTEFLCLLLDVQQSARPIMEVTAAVLFIELCCARQYGYDFTLLRAEYDRSITKPSHILLFKKALNSVYTGAAITISDEN